MPNTRTDPDGFRFYTQSYSNIAAGQTIAAQVKYTKTDSNPSVSSAPQPTSESNNLFWLIALIVLGLTALLGFFILQQRSREMRPIASPASKKKRRDARRGGAATATIFCTQCGHALGPEDNFCPKCGTKRRVMV